MEKHKKRFIIWGFVGLLVFATLAWAATVDRFPQGIATQFWYDYTASSRTVGTYYASLPTLAANDTVMTLATDQTVTGTKTSMPLASPTLTGTVTATGADVVDLDATPDIVYIDSWEDLSTWENAGSGQSYFQMEAGKTYVVDTHAIYTSNGMPDACGSCTTGFSAGIVFSGVSAHAPLATAGTTEKSFKIEYATTGSTGYVLTGVTPVYVYGAPSSGVTDFGYTAIGTGLVSGNNIQNLQYSGGVDGLITPDSEISTLGDSKIWRLHYNSSVSAQVVAETNM